MPLVRKAAGSRFHIHEQVVLGKKPGKEHAVPVLVGHLGYEMLDFVLSPRAPYISELPGVGSKAIAEFSHLECGGGRPEAGQCLSQVVGSKLGNVDKDKRGVVSSPSSVGEHGLIFFIPPVAEPYRYTLLAVFRFFETKVEDGSRFIGLALGNPEGLKSFPTWSHRTKRARGYSSGSPKERNTIPKRAMRT